MAGRFSVSVLAIIPDKRGRVLLIRHTENSDWTLPGGLVRDGENLQQTLLREVRERTGLMVEVGPIFDINTDADKSAVSYFYICKETGGVLTMTQRAVEFGAFSLEDIPANVEPGVRQRLFTYWRDPRPNPAIVPELEMEELAALQAPPKSRTASKLPQVAPKAPQIAPKLPAAPPRESLFPDVEDDTLTKEPPILPPEPSVEPKPPSPPPVKEKKRGFWSGFFWLGPLLITLSAVLLYSITRRGYFVADDFIILNQLHFKQTTFADNLVWFTRDWGVGVNFYRPWVRLAYYFEFTLFGDNAAGWHLFSTGLHTLNSLLIYWLVWLLLRRKGAATVAGLVFALQPIHSEPVSWISGQTDLWATFFVLASTCTFIRARQLQQQKRPNLLIYLASLFSFVMALFSKESAVALPVALLAYDFVNRGLDRLFHSRTETEEEAKKVTGGFLRLVIYQAPFWLLLAAYFGLRLALFNGLGGYTTAAGQTLEFGAYLRTNLRWLATPFSLGGTDGLILLAAIAAFLALTGVQEWERFRLARGESLASEDEEAPNTLPNQQHQNTPRPLPSFWNLRTAAYGVAWAGIFILPAALTPPAERFTYLPSVGFALFLAVCLTPFAVRLHEFEPGKAPRRKLRWRDYIDNGMILRLAAIAIVLVTYFATANERVLKWNDAGETARALLARTKEVIPDVVHYTVFISQGVPESGENSLIFRTGYPEAMQILYKDATVESRIVEHFPIAESLLDRTIFLQYRDDRLINQFDVVKTLLARNANLKKEKSFLFWDFADPSAAQQLSGARGNWSEISGAGRLEVKNGAMEVITPGAAEIQSPGLNLSAVQLGSTEITLRASPRSGDAGSIYRLNINWEPLPTGEPREIESLSFEIVADGQFHTYKITPPVAKNYNYVDSIAYLRLQIPAELQNVTLKSVRQNSIPIDYVNLQN